MIRNYELKTTTTSSHNFRVDYERELNSEQLEAVKKLAGPLLCIAGAGSGKTRTLVYRVARLIESGVPASSILLLTFTRKASSQMLLRASALVGSSGEMVSGGTYHSFANLILRRYGGVIGLSPKFSIMDDSDSLDLINLVRTELGFNNKEVRFPNKKTLKKIHSRAVNSGLSFGKILAREFAHFLDLGDDIIRLFDEYKRYKEKNSLLDYDDLLIFLFKVLCVDDTRERLSGIYRYILVDEYQDTNIVQAQITEALGRKHRNVMVVGDDAQSIYSFRGANYRNIFEFTNYFPEAKIIKLQQNYRSTKAVLKASNHLMSFAEESFKKELFSQKSEGERPAWISCQSEEEQSQFVAQRILELREEGIPLSRIGVLFRSGFHAYQLELELRHRNIPFVKWGGFKFSEAAHIKDIVSHLRILRNPRDFVSWQRTLLLVPGVGTRSIPKLFEAIGAAENSYDLGKLEIPKRMVEGITELGNVLQKAFQASTHSVSTAIEILFDYYLPIVKESYDDFPRRIQDLDHFSVICSKYNDLDSLILDFALEPPAKSVDGTLSSEDEDEERLVLSTIHSAKGLEWHSVFVLWLLEGKFPSFASMKSQENLEEERRLLYVAMTRAEENLFLCHPTGSWDPASGVVLTLPSRFLNEIGEKYLERWCLSKV